MWTLFLGLAPGGQLDLALTADDFVLTAQTERGVDRITQRMFGTYDDVLGLTFPARTSMTVRLIEDLTAYNEAARVLGIAEPTLGFFSARTGEGVVWRNRSEAEMRATLVHEASHFLMVRGGARTAPRWLHEGMATLFGHARLSGNAVYIDPPPGIGPVLDALSPSVPSVEELLERPDAFTRIPRSPTHGTGDYTVGWALCAYLFRSSRGKAVLRELLVTPPGPRMVAVVADRWPGGLRAFDRDWRAWWGAPETQQLPIRSQRPAPADDDGWIRCDSGALVRKASGVSCPKPR